MPYLGGTDLLAYDDQLPHQITETTVFGDLRFGSFDAGTLGNDLGNRLSPNAMRQRIRRTMSRGVLLGAVAVRLATLTETRSQNAWTQIFKLSQVGNELIASIPEYG
jgi:hypothetical protein